MRSIVTIGLVANCDKHTAQDSFTAMREQKFPSAKFAFNSCERTCPKCLRDFIVERKITRLFLDRAVEIAGVDCKEMDEALGAVKRETRCEIYIVSVA